MRCLGCSYALDGLPEARCPECGRTFDPSKPATFRREAGPRPEWHRAFLRAILLGAAAGVVALFWLFMAGPLALDTSCIVLLVCPPLVAGLVVGVFQPSLKRCPRDAAVCVAGALALFEVPLLVLGLLGLLHVASGGSVDGMAFGIWLLLVCGAVVFGVVTWPFVAAAALAGRGLRRLLQRLRGNKHPSA
jgi:hypothetical protein